MTWVVKGKQSSMHHLLDHKGSIERAYGGFDDHNKLHPIEAAFLNPKPKTLDQFLNIETI
jgi:hypothetical protein